MLREEFISPEQREKIIDDLIIVTFNLKCPWEGQVCVIIMMHPFLLK